MVKSKSSGGGTQPNPTARYDLRNRPAKVTKPIPATKPLGRTKRVYRTRGGLVSLQKTPNEFVSTVESNSLQSPLLRLPGELRTKIFKYALGATHILHHWSKETKTWSTKVTIGGVSVFWPQTLKFTLPRVCRQIYHETATMVYSQNIFHFPTTDDLDHFLQSRKQAQVEAMKTLVLEPKWWMYRDGFRCLRHVFGHLERFAGLRKLYLKREQGLWVGRLIFDFVKEDETAVVEGPAGVIEVVFVNLQGVGVQEVRTILP